MKFLSPQLAALVALICCAFNHAAPVDNVAGHTVSSRTRVTIRKVQIPPSAPLRPVDANTPRDIFHEIEPPNSSTNEDWMAAKLQGILAEGQQSHSKKGQAHHLSTPHIEPHSLSVPHHSVTRGRSPNNNAFSSSSSSRPALDKGKTIVSEDPLVQELVGKPYGIYTPTQSSNFQAQIPVHTAEPIPPSSLDKGKSPASASVEKGDSHSSAEMPPFHSPAASPVLDASQSGDSFHRGVPYRLSSKRPREATSEAHLEDETAERLKDFLEPPSPSASQGHKEWHQVFINHLKQLKRLSADKESKFSQIPLLPTQLPYIRHSKYYRYGNKYRRSGNMTQEIRMEARIRTSMNRTLQALIARHKGRLVKDISREEFEKHGVPYSEGQKYYPINYGLNGYVPPAESSSEQAQPMPSAATHDNDDLRSNASANLAAEHSAGVAEDISPATQSSPSSARLKLPAKRRKTPLQDSPASGSSSAAAPLKKVRQRKPRNWDYYPAPNPRLLEPVSESATSAHKEWHNVWYKYWRDLLAARNAHLPFEERPALPSEPPFARIHHRSYEKGEADSSHLLEEHEKEKNLRHSITQVYLSMLAKHLNKRKQDLTVEEKRKYKVPYAFPPT